MASWMRRSAVRRGCGDGLCGAYRCDHLRSAPERRRATGDGHADCELSVRSTDAPDRHIQPQGGLDDAELDAVVPAGTEADEAAGVCADVEADILGRRGGCV